jgi:hypothetical protein
MDCIEVRDVAGDIKIKEILSKAVGNRPVIVVLSDIEIMYESEGDRQE